MKIFPIVLIGFWLAVAGTVAYSQTTGTQPRSRRPRSDRTRGPRRWMRGDTYTITSQLDKWDGYLLEPTPRFSVLPAGARIPPLARSTSRLYHVIDWPRGELAGLKVAKANFRRSRTRRPVPAGTPEVLSGGHRASLSTAPGCPCVRAETKAKAVPVLNAPPSSSSPRSCCSRS